MAKKNTPTDEDRLDQERQEAAKRRAEYLREQMNGRMKEPPPERDWNEAVKGTRLYEGRWRRADDRAKATYLEILALTGRIGEAARAAGACMEVFRLLRLNDEKFKELHEEALQDYRDRLEAEAHRRAVEGWEEPVYQKGELVGYVTKHSDKMLELLLKRHIPEFTDRVAVDAKHSGGVMVIPQTALSEEEWEQQEGSKARHGSAAEGD